MSHNATVATILLLLTLSYSSYIPSSTQAHGDADDSTVTTAPFMQNEIALAVNPAKPTNIIIAYNDFSPLATGGLLRPHYAYSTDGGTTWTVGGAPLSSSGLDYSVCCSPALAFDDNGTAYYVATTSRFDGTGGDQVALYISQPDGSGNAGSVWSAPLVVSNAPGVGRPAIAVDRTGGVHDRNVYIAWVHYSVIGNLVLSNILMRTGRLQGGNFTFTAGPTLASGAETAHAWGPALAVGQSGSVYLSYLTLNGPQITTTNAVRISRSDDGGTSFALREQPVFFMTPPPSVWPATAMPTVTIGANETVLVAWTDGWLEDLDIIAMRSDDRGSTWIYQLQINNDKAPGTTNGKDQFTPVAVAVADHLYVFFYDRRADPSNANTFLYAAESTDNGLSFPLNTAISDTFASSDVCAEGWRQCPWGGTIGADAIGNATSRTLYVAWADGRDEVRGSNDVNIYFEKIASGLVSSPRPVARIMHLPAEPGIYNNFPLLTDNICTGSFSLCLPFPKNTCNLLPSSCLASFSALVLPVEGFQSPVNLYTANVSAGFTVGIQPSVGIPPFNVTITVNATGAAATCIGTCQAELTLVSNSTAGVQSFRAALVIAEEPLLGLFTNVYSRGDALTVVGKGFAANATLSLAIDGTHLTGAQTDALGSFTITTPVPTWLSNSLHTLSAVDTAANAANATLLTPKFEFAAETGGPPVTSLTLPAVLLLNLILVTLAHLLYRRKRT